MLRFITVLAFVFLTAPVCALEVRVAVASNFAPTLKVLAGAFESASGHTLKVSPGSTGRHYAQIINGAPFDVFLAADAKHPALLQQQGFGVADSRFTYAIGQLVLWSPQAGLFDADSSILASGRFVHLAIANPSLAPYGAAAEQVLRKLDLWDALQPRLVRGQNIAQAFQFVASGNADLGFVAYSQLLAYAGGAKGSVWPVPAAMHEPLEQQAMALTDAPAAIELLDWIRSAEASDMIRAAGYQVP